MLDAHTLSDPWRMQIAMLPIRYESPEEPPARSQHAIQTNRTRTQKTEQAMIDYIRKHNCCTVDEIAAGISISKDHVKKKTRELHESGQIQYLEGCWGKKYWSVSNEPS